MSCGVKWDEDVLFHVDLVFIHFPNAQYLVGLFCCLVSRPYHAQHNC
jgi:hypothetical protein